KLQRVYKYRGDDDVVLRTGLFKQCTVTIVQGTHSRNQPDFGGWVAGGLQCCNLLCNHSAYSVNGGGQLGLLVCHETEASPKGLGRGGYHLLGFENLRRSCKPCFGNETREMCSAGGGYGHGTVGFI